MMNKTVNELVKDGNLMFDCTHQTNAKYFLKNKPEIFLEDVLDGAYLLKHEYCFACGKYIDYKLEENKLIPSITTCFDQPEVVLDIPVPSGQLLFDDWLEGSTPVLEYLDKNTFDINCTKVQVDRAMDYAKTGVGHFFVGGSYPDVCVKDSVFYIGRGKSLDEEDDYNEGIPVIEGAEILGSIGTDLRWTTIVDYVVYETIAVEMFGEKEGIKKAQKAKKYADLIVDVEPGTYRITYYPNRQDNIELYAKIEKI